MKICVTSQGEELTSPVDPRFGRARYFIIYDDAEETTEVVDNDQNLNAASGAGVQAGTSVAGLGCEAVISGHMGPKALAVLRTAGVRVFTGAEGTVADALKALAAGELQEATDADVNPRW